MRGRFTGDTERYPLTHNRVYEIDFRNEGMTIFADVVDLKHREDGTYVFPSFQVFIDSWDFEGVQRKPKRMRKFTDFETSKFLSAGEVAEMFSVSVHTVDGWVKTGKLRVSHRIKPRNDRRFLTEDCIKLYEIFQEGYY